MKTLLTTLLFAAALNAFAQSSTVATNPPPVAPSTNGQPALAVSDADTAVAAREASRTLAPPKTLAEVKAERATLGGIAVQAVKTKKPWNLINPFAPMSAGDGTNNLVPNSMGGPPGLNFFNCSK
jgi:hypothetical protein